ncbi:ABC transporter ATP-binding protein [Vibrio sp. 10N.261.55.A7]|uniref:ABC transporter ATP-binding protein n=1 Tax=Vibrio sp. 10N.261.55.A7 TaxID=1880851 RepID=UPI000C851A19|nr:ABC transporter ATP-binding protein [Vibrio sp. 10N.261.55.A7]PMJ88735.1 ABC transporter [Vibrio sp. 10N.261.55.A7]
MYKLRDIEVIRDGRNILSIPDLTIESDQFTVVLGHNGSGKSTLVNLLSNQFSPEKGSVWLNDKLVNDYKPKQLAKSVAYLPQKLPEVAGLSVSELVRLGRYPWRGVFGRWNDQDTELISQAMEMTGVTQYADTIAEQLSGGERQRAWVSMLLAQQSDILILDEPTSALDIQHQYQLMQLLKDLNEQTGKGIIVIIHDLNLALKYASRVVALKMGSVFFQGETKLLHNEAMLSELYSTSVKLIAHPTQNHKVAVVC